jgi:hypothetical protein
MDVSDGSGKCGVPTGLLGLCQGAIDAIEAGELLTWGKRDNVQERAIDAKLR